MSAASAVNTQYNNIVNSTASSDAVSGPQQTMTQNDFLQLLVAQMENQDPLQPQSDTEMASQMAQFTSLTQTTAMSSSLSNMQANSLIGSTVTLQRPNSQQTISGVVQAVVTGAESSDGTPANRGQRNRLRFEPDIVGHANSRQSNINIVVQLNSQPKPSTKNKICFYQWIQASAPLINSSRT